MNKYRYHPVTFTPGLWNHEYKDTVFFLVVDDFAIKFTSEANANHLPQALKDKYEISIDWEAQLYIRISLKWDYVKRTVKLFMPKYVENSLAKFQHILPEILKMPRMQMSSLHTRPIYNMSRKTTLQNTWTKWASTQYKI